jgi:hypothetical protein
MSHSEHKVFNSKPVMGSDGTGFEGSDAPAKVVVYSLAIVGVLATCAFALMFGYDKFLESQHPPTSLPSPLAKERILAPAPQIERLPWLDLPELRAHEKEVLNSSGKDRLGNMHIPIDKAIDLMAAKLDTNPNAPVGLTTPGGQGPIFSHGLADMPAAYQQSQSQAVIQGEIHKNAK